MPRAQCIIHRGNRLLMVKHRQDGQEWWCLPGGGIEPNETAAQAAIRELEEECQVQGVVLRETSVTNWSPQDRSHSFLVDIAEQEPRLGTDPEFGAKEQVPVDMKWLSLREICERDRAYLWAAGLMTVNEFYDEVCGWDTSNSYPQVITNRTR